jgi:hypothetical protein
VRFGYHPGEIRPDGRSLRDYYDACVKMVRADYCGDGQGWTGTGMPVDVSDNLVSSCRKPATTPPSPSRRTGR